MAFITEAECKQLATRKDLFTQLIAEEGTFAAAEKAAGDIITGITGIASPEDIAEAPSWVKLPAAWIINHILLTSQTQPSDSELETSSENYNKAIAELNRRKVKSSGTTAATCAAMEGLYSW